MRNFIPVVAFALSACGGGGNPASMGLSESDPRAVRLERIVDSSNTLLMSAVYQHVTLSGPAGTVSERLITDVACQGTRCENEDGEVFYLHDLFDTRTDVDLQLTSAEVGFRRGFDTMYGEASTASQFDDLSDIVPGTTFTYSTSGEIFGLWGDYGFAATIVLDTPFSGTVLGDRVSGDYDSATGFVFGEKTGTSPGGTGSATWNGIAEAVSTTTFRNRFGTAAIEIADLSRPFLSIDVNLSGYSVGSSNWNNVPIFFGNYSAGRLGEDYVEGNFHGRNHGETYGTFDTGNWVGVFGAKRKQ